MTILEFKQNIYIEPISTPNTIFFWLIEKEANCMNRQIYSVYTVIENFHSIAEVSQLWVP